MSEFCRKCGATFPHRYGEGRCLDCLPRAFAEMEAENERLQARVDELEGAFRRYLEVTTGQKNFTVTIPAATEEVEK